MGTNAGGFDNKRVAFNFQSIIYMLTYQIYMLVGFVYLFLESDVLCLPTLLIAGVLEGVRGALQAHALLGLAFGRYVFTLPAGTCMQ